MRIEPQFVRSCGPGAGVLSLKLKGTLALCSGVRATAPTPTPENQELEGWQEHKRELPGESLGTRQRMPCTRIRVAYPLGTKRHGAVIDFGCREHAEGWRPSKQDSISTLTLSWPSSMRLRHRPKSPAAGGEMPRGPAGPVAPGSSHTPLL